MSRTIVDRATIEAALADPLLVPHRTADSSSGSTIALRNRMARFSAPDLHPARRTLVDLAIAGLDPDHAQRTAFTITCDLVRAGSICDEELARTAPTATMLAMLGLPIDPTTATRDVEAIVRVIGRGEPADASSDAATDRLLAAAANSAHADAVAVVSLLYQNFDATAALLLTRLEARVSATDPEPAVRVTRRVAQASTDLDGHRLTAGDEVLLEIGAAGLPYGAGPHMCPGRELAEAIVRGIVAALDASDATGD